MQTPTPFVNRTRCTNKLLLYI